MNYPDTMPPVEDTEVIIYCTTCDSDWSAPAVRDCGLVWLKNDEDALCDQCGEDCYED